VVAFPFTGVMEAIGLTTIVGSVAAQQEQHP